MIAIKVYIYNFEYIYIDIKLNNILIKKIIY